MDPVYYAVHFVPFIRWVSRQLVNLQQRIADRWRGRWLQLAEILVNALGVVIATGWFLTLLMPHLKMIFEAGPQEYNEPAIWQTTFLIEHGRHPYTEAELPGAAYCFAPLYNYVMLAFKPFLGTDYQAHRIVVLLFLFGSFGLMVRAMRRIGSGLGIALLSAALLYGLCLNNIMITARPDTMGWFFFLLGIYVPWEKNYAFWPVVFGLFCAWIAFNGKYYFAVAGCATLLGMFIMRGKWRAVQLGVVFFAVLGLTLAILNAIFPFLLIETIVVQKAATVLNSRDDISLMHTLMLFKYGWPFMVAMLFALGDWAWRRWRARPSGPTPGPTDPASRDAALRYQTMWAFFLIFLTVVYFYMGRNAGAYFTYHLHLLFPLMFVLTAYVATRRWAKVLFGLLLAVFVMFRITIPVCPSSTGPYKRMEQLIFGCKGDVLGIPAATDILERATRRVIHNGNTMFLGFALADGRAGWDPKAQVIDRKYNGMTTEVMDNVQAREYELVLTEFDNPMFCDPEILKKNYDMVEQLDYYTYFGHSPIRVWRPKPQVPAAATP